MYGNASTIHRHVIELKILDRNNPFRSSTWLLLLFCFQGFHLNREFELLHYSHPSIRKLIEHFRHERNSYRFVSLRPKGASHANLNSFGY